MDLNDFGCGASASVRHANDDGDPLIALLNGRAVPAPATVPGIAVVAPELLTKEQAAAMMSISVRTLDRLVSKNVVPHVRFGKRCVRFPRKALREWLDARTEGRRN